MNFKTIIKLMPNMWQKKQLMLLISVSVLIIIITVFGFFKLIMSYNNAELIKKDITKKSAFVTEYKTKLNDLSNYSLRPVVSQDLESIQGKLLMTLAAHNLKLVSFNSFNGDLNKDNGYDYEIVFSGSWKDTMLFVKNFSLGKALTVIKHLKLETDKDGIKTNLRYKVYILN